MNSSTFEYSKQEPNIEIERTEIEDHLQITSIDRDILIDEELKRHNVDQEVEAGLLGAKFDEACSLSRNSLNEMRSNNSSQASSPSRFAHKEQMYLPLFKSKRIKDFKHGSSSRQSEEMSNALSNDGSRPSSAKNSSKQTYKGSIRSRTSSQNSEASASRAEKASKRSTKAWTEEEDRLLRFYYSKHNGKWPAIASDMSDRNASQCSQRWRRIKPSKIRRPWTAEEDVIVMQLINQHGKNWGIISAQMDNRSGKQVRERYINKLDPQLNNELFTDDEDKIIIDKYYIIGPKWSEIAKYLVGRSENMVKNRFYSYIKKTYAISSLPGHRSDTGSIGDANSSPRIANSQYQEDKNSSYVSSHYNELDPSIGSENKLSEDSSSENEQYQQFSLGPNPGQFNHSKLEEENSFGPSYEQQQQMNQNNTQFNANQQLPTQQQSQQQPLNLGGLYLPGSGYSSQQNAQSQQLYTQAQTTGLFRTDSNNNFYDKKQIPQQNGWNRQDKADDMLHTPRLALANNSSFFPTEMFMQQQRFQDDTMNSNGQQQLGNNFFQAAPSPLLLLSPAQGKGDQLSFVLNTPNQQRYILSNSNTPYGQQQPNSNNPNSLNSNGQKNIHFNFANIASTPNYKPQQHQQPQQQQQSYQSTQYMYPPQTQQQYMQQIDMNGNPNNQPVFNFSSSNQPTLNTAQKSTNFDENLENLSINPSPQVQGGSFFLPHMSQNQNNVFLNEYQQQFYYQQQQQQHQQHQQYQQQSQQTLQTQPIQDQNNFIQGTQYNQLGNQLYLNQQNQRQVIQTNGKQTHPDPIISSTPSVATVPISNNTNPVPELQSQNSNPRDELRIDVSYGLGFDQQQAPQQPSGNIQNALATPKIDRKQLKNLIVDLETQLQLLRVQQSNLNDEDSDN